jgi:phage-related protein (TIGR01555 family)
MSGKEKTIAKIVTDGWVNLLAGMGLGKDRASNTKFGLKIPTIHDSELRQLYINNGFARKIVDIYPHEMTREWIHVENDADNKILVKLDDLDAEKIFCDALTWAALFGGSVIVMGIDDSGLLDTPLREDSIRSVDFLRVYDRHQISWTLLDVNNDPQSAMFGKPEYFNIQPYSGGSQFRVHASRILMFDGVSVPELERAQNEGWGYSFLQAIYTDLKDYGIIKASSVSIVMDFVQTILQIENLTDLIGNGHEDLVKKRLDLIDMTRSVMNTILLDADENYTKQSSSVAGLSDLIIQFGIALAGVTGIPFTKLFGQAPAGMNATGESDMRNFYDEVKTKQKRVLLTPLNRLIYLIGISKNGPYSGKAPTDLTIQFNPLWQMTDQQEADWKYKIAQTDEVYVRNGILGPEEVAISRFGDGFNPDTEIDLNNRILPEPEPEITNEKPEK